MSMAFSKRQGAALVFMFVLLFGGQVFAPAQQAMEKEPNDEAKQANPLPLNQDIKGFANQNDDKDWYALTIPPPGLDILVIEVSGISDIDLGLRL